MTSTKLRKINQYQCWKTDAGIDSVINYLRHHVFPANLTTEKQRDSFANKFDSGDWIAQHVVALVPGGFVGTKIFYAPRIDQDNTNPYSMKLEVVRPRDRQQKMRLIYQDLNKSLGVGKAAFFFQVASKYINITRNMSYGFLKSQGNYQIQVKPKHIINKPTTAIISKY